MKILNLMNKKKLTAQGSITVFMTFIFMIILSLILAIFENTRIISSTGYMKNASLSAEKTLFGDYNLELYKEYGLLDMVVIMGLITMICVRNLGKLLKKIFA